MFRKLTITDFKSFASCELEFGPSTVVIGANGTGKSNLREALKLLHGIARGYSLSDIFIERSNHGVKEWDGIRGGVGHAARAGAQRIKLALECDMGTEQSLQRVLYEVAIQTNPQSLCILGERLAQPGTDGWVDWFFYTHGKGDFPASSHEATLRVDLPPGGNHRKARSIQISTHKPALLQVAQQIESNDWRDWPARHVAERIKRLQELLGRIRFLDLDPRQMRMPSAPQQDILTENGGNLSGVLQRLDQRDESKAFLASWVSALTPIPARSMSFDTNQDGRVIASIVTSDDRHIPLSVVSDGTLRFLGLLAAAYGPEPASLLCIEEAETGLHPVRLQLLADLLQRRVTEPKSTCQALFTTHAPALLRGLGDAGIEHGYLAVKSPNSDDTELRPLKSIPHIREIVGTPGNDLGDLLETGWFETTTAMESLPQKIEFEPPSEEEIEQ
jgi:predicted ATPase